jgi:predicted RND superfamily exporter protein
LIAHRGVIIAAVCVCTVLVVWLCAERLRIESGLDELLSWSSRVHDSEVVSKFEAETEIVVLVEGDVLSREGLERVRQVRDALRALALPHEAPRTTPSAVAHAQARAPAAPRDTSDWAEGAGDTDAALEDAVVFREVASIIDARRFVRHDEELEAIPWLPEDGSAPSAAQRAALHEAPGDRHWIDAEGRHTALYLRAPPLAESESLRLCAMLKSLLERFSTPQLRFSALGVPVMKSELTSLLVRDMERLFGIALLACMGILAYTFRHPLAVLGPMLVIVIATVWTAGAMALTGVPVTVVMLYLPAFLTCVAVGDSVHIQNTYFEERRAGAERSEAIIRALQTTTRPIIYTAVTTSCGMLGLCAARTPALKQLGMLAAVGVLFAMLMSFLVVPLALTFHRGAVRTAGAPRAKGETSVPPPGTDGLTRFLLRAASWSAPHRPRARLRLWGLVALMAALFGLSTLGLSRIHVHHDTLDWLPRASQLREAVAKYDQHLGGAVPIELVIEARKPTTVRDAGVLERVARLRDALRAYDAHASSEPRLVMGTTGVVEALEQAAEIAGKEGEPVARPWDQGATRDLFAFIEWLAPDVLSRFVSVDSEQTRMRLQLRWTHAAAYVPFLDYARKSAAEILGPNASVKFMGAGFDMVAVFSQLLRELQGSFTLAFLLEVVTLAVFLRGVRLALIAMLPNLLPVLMVLAFMGFTGLPIDIHTLLLAPIALGVVTDDTAHFMHSVKQRLAATGDVEDALNHTLCHVGRSIVINGATLTAGFGVYLAASMQSMQRLAILVVLTITLSLLADLVFTPVLIRIAFRGAQRARI